MIQGLDELSALSAKLELMQPETQAIIAAYVKREAQRLEEPVYSVLEQRHPCLRDFIAKAREGGNPVQQWRSIEDTMAQASLIGSIASIIPDDLDEEITAAKQVFRNLGAISELYNKATPVIEQVYASCARTAKEIAATAGMTPEEVVASDAYRDEITRKVFPTRLDLQQFYDVSQRVRNEMLNLTKSLMVTMKATGMMPAETVDEHLSKFPTDEARSDMNALTSQYRAREMDRIYA
jgi:hypothetical protein